MDCRPDTGADNSENSHGLGETVNRGTPALAQQEENRRDQRPGVTDTDPEYKIGDIESPTHWNLQTPGTDTIEEEIDHDGEIHQGESARDADSDIPSPGSGAFYNLAHPLGDIMERRIAAY